MKSSLFPDQLTISKIKALLSTDPVDPQLIAALKKDSRRGVTHLVSAYYRRLDRHESERQKWQQMCSYETKYWEYELLVAGVDEAGRGPLAGPVVAAAVVLPPTCYIPGLNDSKSLSSKRRASLLEEIVKVAVDYAVGIVGPGQIDDLNIFQATQLAMKQAVNGLVTASEIVLVDGDQPCRLLSQKQLPIIKGDALSVSIAAASIVAKETRDSLMIQMDTLYPGYGFADHKGYGTQDHLEALGNKGPSPIHRRSFAPVAALYGEGPDIDRQKKAGPGR